MLESRFGSVPWFSVGVVKQDVQLPPFGIFNALSVSVCWALNVSLKCVANIIWKGINKSSCWLHFDFLYGIQEEGNDNVRRHREVNLGSHR